MKCLRCDEEMVLYSRVKFSTHPTAYAGFTFEINVETTEAIIPVNIYVCPKCKKLEFFCAEKAPITRTVICPHCSAENTLTDDSPAICSHCGKDIYEKVPGRNYIRPKNF